MAVKKLKSGKYQADWRDESGVRRRKSFPNKVRAEYFLSQQRLFDSTVEGKVCQAINYKQMTVSEITERYLKEHLQFSRAHSNSAYLDLIKERWGVCNLFRVSSAEVRQWISSFINESDPKKKYSLSSIKKILAYFKRLFNWAIENEIVSTNPIQGVSFKKEFRRVNRRSVALESDQFWDLINKLPEEPKYLRQISIAAWCTGMRVGEIINLKWENVDRNNWIIRLKADETKESDIKVIGIETELIEVIKNRIKAVGKIQPTDYVFVSSVDEQIDPHCLDRAFRKHSDRAGFKNVRLHDFRHCYTRRKRREGFDRSVIKAQTGHHTDSMFDWYDKVDEEEIKAMSGNRDRDTESVNTDIVLLCIKAKEKGISLGAVQSLIGRSWRAKAA